MQVPDVRYARSNDLRLAYQQWGAGPRLLLVHALLSNMEVAWEHEYIVRIYEMMDRHVEVVQFDKRGIGLSDRPEVAPTLEERIGDIVAVMDDVGWERANLLGISVGGVMTQLFAATYPERVDKLILHNTFPPPGYWSRAFQLVREGDAPLSSTEEVLSMFDRICEDWPECVEEFVDWFMPDQSDNASFVRWLGRFMPLSASPRLPAAGRKHHRDRRR